MKYIVEYQFINDYEIITKKFNDFLGAMKYQGEIVKKYKNKLNYCIYKECEE